MFHLVQCHIEYWMIVFWSVSISTRKIDARLTDCINRPQKVKSAYREDWYIVNTLCKASHHQVWYIGDIGLNLHFLIIIVRHADG